MQKALRGWSRLISSQQEGWAPVQSRTLRPGTTARSRGNAGFGRQVYRIFDQTANPYLCQDSDEPMAWKTFQNDSIEMFFNILL